MREKLRERARQEIQRRQQGTRTAQELVKDPLTWLQKHTQTKDPHWREVTCKQCGAQPKILCAHKTPFRPFPDKPYFQCVLDYIEQNPTVWFEKSRDMMMSWLCVGKFTHEAMTNPGIEVVFQSLKEDKAFELVDYAKCLYERSDPLIKQAYPLAKPLERQGAGELLFANGSRIFGIPGGEDQIRSYHPWGLLLDEAAFQPEAGGCYEYAISSCQKIVVLSSAGPGWFADVCQSAV